ncbi:hypothetical protein MLD38_009363 [Melastoma candidum]|uniref:Uncharacterized protein n=1 Tax=Melastoma candidum TaxID=119954 RepID=A0ACB9RWF9_9MYRT|nr:hypothetical protein MLD38_009363 [Melastoma candidum]
MAPLYMPLFRSCATLRSLRQLHAHLIVASLGGDPLPTTKLIQSYAEMDDLCSSDLVFRCFRSPDPFMWGVLIKCHAWCGSHDGALSAFRKLTATSRDPVSSFTYPSVLRACSCGGRFRFGECVHGRLVKCGLDCDDVIRSSLVSLYGEMGRLDSVRKLFDEMTVRDVVSWTCLISCYVDNGDPINGLRMVGSMISEGFEVDRAAMICVAEACGELGWLSLARSVHGQVVTGQIRDDSALVTSLIVMYSRCGDLWSARSLFDYAASKGTTSWTAMISSYNQSGRYFEALEKFLEMQKSQVEPNPVTVMAVLCSCARLGWLRGGKSAHCFVVRNSLDVGYEFLGPPLIEFYADCGRVCDSKKVFSLIGERDAVSWNMLISCYTRKRLFYEALSTFIEMRENGVQPDSFNLTSALSACENDSFSWPGRQIHGYIIKMFHQIDFLQNSMICMYSKCGDIESAYRVFLETAQRDTITWNSMMSGYFQNGNCLEAIRIFDHMYLGGMMMNEVSFLLAIQASSHGGYFEKGKWVHHKLIVCGVKADCYIDSALADMYSKCGDLYAARTVFENMDEKTVVSWSVMIDGYGMHGHVDAAVALFDHMVESGIKPNDVTFMNLLSACAHSGSIEEGRFYFSAMKNFGVPPKWEHYSCFIDMLSRSGNLDEAYSVINSMPYPVDASIWGALLNGCRIHQRTDMTQIIRRHLLEVNTDDTGYYTLLSNLYAEEKNWSESRKVRLIMENAGLQKVPGYSLIELGQRNYRFGAGDITSDVQEICNVLEYDSTASFLQQSFQRIAVHEAFKVGFLELQLDMLFNHVTKEFWNQIIIAITVRNLGYLPHCWRPREGHSTDEAQRYLKPFSLRFASASGKAYDIPPNFYMSRSHHQAELARDYLVHTAENHPKLLITTPKASSEKFQCSNRIVIYDTENRRTCLNGPERCYGTLLMRPVRCLLMERCPYLGSNYG